MRKHWHDRLSWKAKSGYSDNGPAGALVATLDERDEAKTETRLIASRAVELIRERDTSRAVARAILQLARECVGQKFLNGHALLTHEWLEDGEQPYCPICDDRGED